MGTPRDLRDSAATPGNRAFEPDGPAPATPYQGGLFALLTSSARTARAWLLNPFHRRSAVALVLVLGGDIAYSVYRAERHSTDLINGILEPTRGVLFHGKQIYVDYIYNSYSPFFYSAMAPLAWLPNWAASLAWSLLAVVQLVAIVAITLALLARAHGKRPPAVFAGPLLAAALIADNLHLGQTNIFTLFFVCGALWYLQGEQHLKAGLWLSVAIAFKVTPALLLVPLIIRRRFSTLAGVAAGLIAWLGIVPAVVFGPAKGWALVGTWFKLIAARFVSGEQAWSVTKLGFWYHTNQSLEAFVQRHFTPYGAQRYGGLHQLIDPGFLTEAQASAVALVARLLIVAVVVVVVWRHRHDARRVLPLEAAIVLLAMLFISPVSWINHYVFALVALVVAANEVDWRPRPGSGRRVLVGALAATVVLTVASVGRAMQSYSLLFIAYFVLFCALVWLALRKYARPSPPAVDLRGLLREEATQAAVN